MSCKYAQREVKNDVKKLRCVNKPCDSFLEIVDLDVCSGCPFSTVRKERKCDGCEAPEAPAPAEIFDTPKYSKAENMMDKETLEALNLDDIPKEFPSVSTQLWNYQNALRKWNKAGRPVRSPEEIKEILETRCKGCDWYDKESERCKGCGCKVTEDGMAIFNKIKMATESCPKELW
jgi:hypothetical protein